MNFEDAANVKVLIETSKYIITGNLVLDSDSMNFDMSSKENVLLYVLNCGKKFISLHDCVVGSKDHAEYQPELIEYFHLNLDIVHTCRLIKED